MKKLLLLPTLTLLFTLQITHAQQPKKLNSVEIYQHIQKLNFLGSVLYIAAHPDDENTRLISFLSNETKARTAYLSLTRGDGGQNLIGAELRELLGVIRTQELIEARKIDGGEQLFTRANDFGFSKNPEETFQIWNKEKIAADIVWAIRKFQPDIIINRFDHRTSGTTHGHHTASAILSVDSFNQTNNPNVFPEQLKSVTPWQVKRQFFNPSWYFYGSKEKFEAADKSKFIPINTGVYYQTIGKSNQEIAALSRSCHQSQGFGSTGSRGEDVEYLELINGEDRSDKRSIFEGIDTSWNRVKGGKPIGDLVSKIAFEFDFKNPASSIPDLVRTYSLIQTLEENHWKKIKLEELKNCIAACAGLFLEAVSQEQETTPSSVVQLKLEIINRSAVPMLLESVLTLPNKKTTVQNLDLKKNTLHQIKTDLQLPATIDYTQPYWLKEKGSIGTYTVSDSMRIGEPDVIREVKVVFNLLINGVSIPYERIVVYKYNDEVQGETYRFLEIIPEVSTSIVDKVTLFKTNSTETVAVKIKAGKDYVKGVVSLELPEKWLVSPQSIPFYLDKKETEHMVFFNVTPPNQPEEVTAKSVVVMDNKKYDKEQITIHYPHITKQQVLQPAESKFVRLDLKTTNEKIGYIMGAGDEVPKCLQHMGYAVSLLKPEEITPEKLSSFDVVITGIRAYNVLQILDTKQEYLFDFVKQGKTMLVQYNTPNAVVTSKIAPFPLQISNNRVTEENAAVRFLAPEHPVLHFPNQISTKDFDNWKQEQGLYYPNEFDAAFTPIISSHDKGETPKTGALLIAPYGKGYYVYTGLSFFRELPEGVAGAFRLLANIISLKNKSQTAQNQKP